MTEARRVSDYVYDFMNRLTGVNDLEQDDFDEYFAYDAQGRITSQRRGANVNNKSGGEYVYYSGTNKLKSVANGMGGTTADKRDMSASDNFEYDADGNMTNDNSKDLTIAYDWRGMPMEFKRFRCTTKGSTVCDSVKLVMAYDGSGRRISKTRLRRDLGASDWAVENVTHYTGIGTEVRESYFGGALDNAKVVVKSLQGESRKNKLACSYDRTAAADAKGVHMPQGLGRYMPEDASAPVVPSTTLDENGKPTDWSIFNPKFEWYLKNHQGESSENALVHFHCRAAGCCALRHNHLGSTMLVYGSDASANGVKAAYDYRAFGEQVDLAMPTDKVTENFTGKEKDDETDLNYFGARYLDPMLGLWISVDPARQFSSPYLYAGNGVNPVNGMDDDGNYFRYPDEATEHAVMQYVQHISPEARFRFDQLAASKYRYDVMKVDGGQIDPDDGENVGGLARPWAYENGEIGGAAYFSNIDFFLHEVLSHLWDFDNSLKVNFGDVDATIKEMDLNRDEFEKRARAFEKQTTEDAVNE